MNTTAIIIIMVLIFICLMFDFISLVYIMYFCHECVCAVWPDGMAVTAKRCKCIKKSDLRQANYYILLHMVRKTV